MIKQILDSLVDTDAEVAVLWSHQRHVDKLNLNKLTIEDGIYKWGNKTFTWQNVSSVQIHKELEPIIEVD